MTRSIKSKILSDKDGPYVPVTHVDAVFDGNGTPLSELLSDIPTPTPTPGGVADGEEIPASLGVAYAIIKAREMIKISQYMRASLPVPAGAQSAGNTLVGLPYSSTRKTNTFVPNNTSYETYMSALSDPESYAYTVNPNLGTNGALYYGTVCAFLVQHCLGIDVARHRNISLFGIPGVEKVSSQDAQSMRLGYFINYAKGSGPHAMICTGIVRQNGVITQIRMSESVQPVCREVSYTPEAFNALLTNYTICRYTKIELNTYKPLLQFDQPILFNRNVQTKKGTRSMWGIEEDVILDILDRGSYTKYRLRKNGSVVATEDLPVTATINLGALAYGKYELCLTDGTNDSPSVEWLVVDYSVTPTALSGGIIRVAFSSANAVPVGIAWSDSNYMFQIVKEVGEAERVAGTMDTFLDSTTQWANYGVPGYSGYTEYDINSANFTTGTPVYVRMLFLTEYGTYTSPQPATPVSFIE